MKLTGGTRSFDSSLWVHGGLNVDDPVNLTGNVETASALQTARNISLSSDATGSVSFDGTADVDIIVSITNDSHTHDLRYYTKTELNEGQLDTIYYSISTLNSGQLDNRYYTETELNPAAVAGENVLDARYYTETEIDSALSLYLPLTGGTISSDLTVSGNLTVNGTTTTIDTTELTIEDNLIVVNSNQTGTPSSGLLSGIEVERGDETNYHFLFRESDDTFVIGEAGNEQAVATREDSPVSFGIPYWNSTSVSLITLPTTGTSGRVLTSNGDAAPSWEEASSGVSTVLSGSSTVGALTYNGLTALEGALHGGANSPTGTEALTYNGYLYATKLFNAVYNDVAEFIYYNKESTPGQVLVSKNRKVQPSTRKGSKNVVGVHSDSFGYALGSEHSEEKTPVGLAGRVEVLIKEPCKEGDLLLSGKDGFASVKKWYNFSKGRVIGKALQSKSTFSVERIDMLIMLG